jgi:hypothetical protein
MNNRIRHTFLSIVILALSYLLMFLVVVAWITQCVIDKTPTMTDFWKENIQSFILLNGMFFFGIVLWAMVPQFYSYPSDHNDKESRH